MKKKFLALTMASAIMLMGAGYAYWTDQLTVNNTITTGTFNVDLLGTKAGGGSDDQRTTPDWNKYVQATAAATGKTVTATLGNMYPGSNAWVKVEEKNTGTIPATFDYADVTITGDEGLKGKLVYWLSYQIKDKNGAVKVEKLNQYSGDLSTFTANLNSLLSEVRLEPGEEIVLGDVDDQGDAFTNEFKFRLPNTVVNADDVEGKSVQINITLNWKQHNAPKTAATAS